MVSEACDVANAKFWLRILNYICDVICTRNRHDYLSTLVVFELEMHDEMINMILIH
jgi:hypothetical protein